MAHHFALMLVWWPKPVINHAYSIYQTPVYQELYLTRSISCLVGALC